MIQNLYVNYREKYLYVITFAKDLLRWFAGLNPIQLEQQKTQLALIILAKNLKPILSRVTKNT